MNLASIRDILNHGFERMSSAYPWEPKPQPFCPPPECFFWDWCQVVVALERFWQDDRLHLALSFMDRRDGTEMFSICRGTVMGLATTTTDPVTDRFWTAVKKHYPTIERF